MPGVSLDEAFGSAAPAAGGSISLDEAFVNKGKNWNKAEGPSALDRALTSDWVSHPLNMMADLGHPQTWAEAPLAISTGFALGTPAKLISGLGAIAHNAMVDPVNAIDPAEMSDAMQQAFTYQPKSQYSRDFLEHLSVPGQAMGAGASAAGHKVTDVTGSPLAGAVTESALSVGSSVLGAKLLSPSTPAPFYKVPKVAEGPVDVAGALKEVRPIEPPRAPVKTEIAKSIDEAFAEKPAAAKPQAAISIDEAFAEPNVSHETPKPKIEIERPSTMSEGTHGKMVEFVNRDREKKAETPLTDEQIREGTEKLTPVMEKAAADKPDFDASVREIADSVGGEAKIPSLKRLERAVPKLITENKGEVEKMRDLVRSTVTVDDMADAQKVIDAISDRFTITRLKNRTNDTSLTHEALEHKGDVNGYEDLLINVRLPSGIEGEIQVMTPEMFAHKDPLHKIYEVTREYEVNAPDHPELAEGNAIMRAGYEEAKAANAQRLASRGMDPGLSVGPVSRSKDATSYSTAESNSAADRDLPSTSTERLNLGDGLTTASPLESTHTTKPSGESATGSSQSSKNLVPEGKSLENTGTSDQSIAPPVPEGYTRLYRGSKTRQEPRAKDTSEEGRYFTTRRASAKMFGDIEHYVDVPNEVAQRALEEEQELGRHVGRESWIPSRRLLPAEWANKAKPLEHLDVDTEQAAIASNEGGSVKPFKQFEWLPELSDAEGAKAMFGPDFEAMGKALKPGWAAAAKATQAVRVGAREIAEDLQMAVTPMALGTDRARVIAKQFAENQRLARWQWSKFDDILKKTYKPEQRRDLYLAAEEENQKRLTGDKDPAKGLARLSPEDRAVLDTLHTYGNELWARAKALKMVEGDGVPFWTPRMVVKLSEEGDFTLPESPQKGEGRGSANIVNLTTTSPNFKRRKYQTLAETEAAAKTKFGEEAEVAKDIRAMPLAMERIERAIAGRELINSIKEVGKMAGHELVSDGAKPGFFTIDHPAFRTMRPAFEERDGKVVPKLDQDGDIIFEKVPVFVSTEFEGPLKAVLEGKSGPTYKAAMAMKGKSTSLLMYSPAIHNFVEWGRSLPALPGKVITGRVYWEGSKAKKDPETMRQAIKDGLVPIGHRGGFQDITGIMEEPTLSPGRSLTAKGIGGTVGFFDKKSGEAVKTGIDAAGDFWHNTLLWDRVGDLQMGLYVNFKNTVIKKGLSQEAAGPLAAHLANRYAGAIPNESMSQMARKFSNIMLFSRSFTMGNLGVMKDIITGLPRDVVAQIRHDAGNLMAERAISIGRRKAIAAFALDVALFYGSVSLLQDAFDYLKRDKSLSDIEKGYVDRFHDMVHNLKENPIEILNPYGALDQLSSTSNNEPGKEGRVYFGQQDDGTAIYLRLPFGKLGEDFEGWSRAFTGDLSIVNRKLSQYARPALDLLTNQTAYGQQLYDPDDKGVKGAAKRVGRIVTNFMAHQLPTDSLESASALRPGGGGSEVDAYKTIGPLFGLTFSKGAPGGPAVGEMFEQQRRHRAEVTYVMPDVRRLLSAGRDDEAEAKMREAHMTSAEIKVTKKLARNPGARLSPRAMREFYGTATDQEKARMDRMRGIDHAADQ